MAHASEADRDLALLRKWQDVLYLQTGSERQRRAWVELHHLGVLEILRPFDGVLIGTIPLGIDVPGSDLDIACSAPSIAALEQLLASAYGALPGYRSTTETDSDGTECLVVDFQGPAFPVQLFAQRAPVARQRGYRHLLVEALLLGAAPGAREPIMRLRAAGLKTEPAFARHFLIPGDPYAALYEMSYWDEPRIEAFVRASSRSGNLSGRATIA